jgi:hypothetical protein
MKIGKLRFAIILIVLVVLIATLGGVWQKYNDINAFPQSTPTQLTSTAEFNNILKEYQGKLHLFILAGQSNMSGRGDIPQTAAAPNPRIYVFGNNYQWRLAAEPIDDPHDQVDKVSEDKNAGYSPALSFAETIVERRPEMSIGLIPCAMDSTTIHDWERNLSDKTLYGSCLKRARAASTMGSVAGVLFFQGESDALDPKKNPDLLLSPDQWADKFTVLINDWRSDLGLPELPVVFAQIGTNTRPNRYPNWKAIQQQQSSVRLQFCKMITTDDLALGDTVHFTTKSYQIIGKRFAEAYLEFAQE